MKDLESPLSAYNIKTNSKIMMMGTQGDPMSPRNESLKGPSFVVEGQLVELKMLKDDLDKAFLPILKKLKTAISKADPSSIKIHQMAAEMLLQTILKVDSFQNPEVRDERKLIVNYIQDRMKEIDNILKKI